MGTHTITRILAPFMAFAVAFALAGAAGAAIVTTNATGFTLGNNGTTLVTVGNLNNLAGATGSAITNGSGGSLSLSDLAYRPRTGQLYGYANATDSVYIVDPLTGVATFQAALKNATSVESLGADFNNVVDALRVVSTANENIVFFPNNVPPNIAAFTNLFYAEGDGNEGVDPAIFGNAYTNAIAFPTTTLQFGLDATTDALVTVANNAGTLVTQGRFYFASEPLDVTDLRGFDILSFSEGDNTALALVTSSSTAFSGQGLFLVPLVADAMGGSTWNSSVHSRPISAS